MASKSVPSSINPMLRDELAEILRNSNLPENAPRSGLRPEQLKALAIEMAAAMPPLPARALQDVLTDAFALSKDDRAIIENCMRASRMAGLNMEAEILRRRENDHGK